MKVYLAIHEYVGIEEAYSEILGAYFKHRDATEVVDEALNKQVAHLSVIDSSLQQFHRQLVYQNEACREEFYVLEEDIK